MICTRTCAYQGVRNVSSLQINDQFLHTMQHWPETDNSDNNLPINPSHPEAGSKEISRNYMKARYIPKKWIKITK